MKTLKFTIEKTEKREVEFEIPCFRKNEENGKLYKIISAEEIYEMYIAGEQKISFHKWTTLWSDAKESVKITEYEWIEGMKKFAEYSRGILMDEGLTMDGLPLPTPEMFGLDKNGNKIKRDENLIES